MGYRSHRPLDGTVMRRTSILLTAIAVLVEGLLGAATGQASAAARSDPSASSRIESPPAMPAKRFVVDAQTALTHLGYDAGPIDGVVGLKTRDALTRYQRAEGLPRPAGSTRKPWRGSTSTSACLLRPMNRSARSARGAMLAGRAAPIGILGPPARYHDGPEPLPLLA